MPKFILPQNTTAPNAELIDNIDSSSLAKNAFSQIKIDSVLIQSDSSTDILEFASGTNISIVPDETNDKIVINSTYTHPSLTSVSLNQNLTGANVLSNISISGNSDGHLSSATITTRTLTLGDLGYTGATNADYYNNWSLYVGGVSKDTVTTGEKVDFQASTGLSVAHSTSTGNIVTYTNTDRGSSQNIFKNMSDGTNVAVADINNDTFTFAQGDGLTVLIDATNDKVTYSHADTSTVADLTSAANTFVTAETFDTYGHVLTITTGTVNFNVADNYAFKNVSIGTDSGYTWGVVDTNITQVAESNNDTLTLVNGSGINLYANNVAGTDAIKIENADKGSSQNIFKNMSDGTNVAAAESNNDTFTFAQNGGLTVLVDAMNDNVTYSHADTSTIVNIDNSNGVVIQDLTFDTYGHVLTSASIDLDTRYYTTTSANSTFAVITRKVSAGTGLTGGGDFSADRTISLGTPSTVTISTTNNTSGTTHTHALSITAGDFGLGNVENKSSAMIRSEITNSNVTTALGYTPINKAGDNITGNLGVGVAIPTEALDVTGNIKASGTVKSNDITIQNKVSMIWNESSQTLDFVFI